MLQSFFPMILNEYHVSIIYNSLREIIVINLNRWNLLITLRELTLYTYSICLKSTKFLTSFYMHSFSFCKYRSSYIFPTYWNYYSFRFSVARISFKILVDPFQGYEKDCLVSGGGFTFTAIQRITSVLVRRKFSNAHKLPEHRSTMVSLGYRWLLFR